MQAYKAAAIAPVRRVSSLRSQDLKIAITFKRSDHGPGLTKFPGPLSLHTVQQFAPEPIQMDRAIYELSKLGFRPTKRGRFSVSVRGTKELFEKVFGTVLAPVFLDVRQSYTHHCFYFPPNGAPWHPMPAIAELIDDAYIQWPHIYMNGTASAPALSPPRVNYFHLEMPQDVPTLLNVRRVHQCGTTGKGVRVVMVDSGFAHKSHPFFDANGYASTVDLAPNATNDQTDTNGHGTGESANLFAVAPGATFIGIKVDNDNDPANGASLLEGFQTAMEHQPNVISISMGYDLRDSAEHQQTELPNNLAALEAEVQSAVASGVTVVFSAGNGHFSFPGMMPDVISVGGVYIDDKNNMQASNYASAFDSKIYSGRHVPDFCGLVGLLPHASYIMLPIPGGCEIDKETSAPDDGSAGDGTDPSDGWGVFSGTSAAAPQLAGVCALLLEKNPKLTPSDIKSVLRRTAVSVLAGSSNPDSSDDGTPQLAGPGDHGAAGAGLIDAFAAWSQV